MAKGIGKVVNTDIVIDGETFTIKKMSCEQMDSIIALEEEKETNPMKVMYFTIACSVINPDGTYMFTPEGQDEFMENSTIEGVTEISEAIMEFNGFGDDSEGK